MPSPNAYLPLLPPETVFTWLSIDDVEAPPLKAGAAWWRLQRGDRLFPTRAELKPRQIAGLMPYMSLLKVIDGGADFDHRIVGDVQVRAFNVRIQNRRYSEIATEAPHLIAHSVPLLRRVLESCAPLAWTSISGRNSVNVMFTSCEMLMLPLGDGEAVDHILVFGVFRSEL